MKTTRMVWCGVRDVVAALSRRARRQSGVATYGRTARSRGSATLRVMAGLLVLLSISAHATIYYANGGLGNNSYDGLSDMVIGGDGPKLNVTNAIAAASNGDTVQVDDGFYQETNWDLSAKSVTLNPNGLVIVYQSNPSNTFTIGDGISDGWRQYYFADAATTNSDSCALCNPSGDGENNLFDYLNGYDPLDYFGGILRPPSCFTNVFATNHLFVAVLSPTNGGIFFAGNSVTVTSTVPIEVYRMIYGGQTVSYTNGSSPLAIVPPMGQYFVQTGSNRTEFVVFPAEYTSRKLQNVGHDDSFASAFNGLSDRAEFNWVRVILDWGSIQINNGGAFNWTNVTNSINEEFDLTNYFGKENIVLNFGHADWAFFYAFPTWLTDYSNYVAAAYAQYGTNSSIVRLDPLSEASDGAFETVFTNQYDYTVYATAVYQVVSAAWPGVSQIGASESSPGAYSLVASMKAAGADTYLKAVDYHDYSTVYAGSEGDPDDLANGVNSRVSSNSAALGTTNVFVTELGLLGASSLGFVPDWANTNFNTFGENSIPPYGWYRGMTRAIRTAVLYSQHQAKVFMHVPVSGGPDETNGLDGDGNVRPKTAAFLVASYWVNGATPVTNWISGNVHFAESVWSNGVTNTFVWATEGTTVTTNLSVGMTDIYSNAVTGAIGEEPVIAWGWPK